MAGVEGISEGAPGQVGWCEIVQRLQCLAKQFRLYLVDSEESFVRAFGGLFDTIISVLRKINLVAVLPNLFHIIAHIENDNIFTSHWSKLDGIWSPMNCLELEAIDLWPLAIPRDKGIKRPNHLEAPIVFSFPIWFLLPVKRL